MSRNARPRGSVAALTRVISEAAQDLVTASAKNSAVVLCNSTTSSVPGSNLKAGIVTVLGWLLAWRPSVALALGKIVTRIWRGSRLVTQGGQP
jgi:hypothetical protein